MKSIFSITIFAALTSALVSAAPLTGRTANGPVVATYGADFYRVISQASPDVDQTSNYGLNTAVVACNYQGLNEIDTFVSFAIPPLAQITGATESSTCDLVIYNAGHVYGTQNIQLFTIGAEIDQTQPLTFNSHPYYNQYEGRYIVNDNGPSVAIDVFTVPCIFQGNMQFVMRPMFNGTQYITWDQAPGINSMGAFIEIRN
jgi:hypothetical protein